MNKKVWVVLVMVALVAAGIFFDPRQTVTAWIGGDAFHAGFPTRVWANLLVSNEVSLREDAIEKLSATDPGCVAVLRQIVVQAHQAEARWTAAELLGKKKGAAQSATPELLQALQDSDPHVRTVAATALPEVEAPAAEAVPALRDRLRDETPVPVIRALSRYAEKAQPALGDLLEIMQDESLPEEVRWNATRTIGKMREAGAEAIPILVASLHDQPTRIREHAAEALGDIGPPSRSVVDKLFPLLADPDVKVRRDAVRSIGQIGADPAIIPEIEKLVNDPETIVRDAAKKTLEQLRAAPTSQP